MAIRNILRIGDSRLREHAKPVTTFDTPELHSVVQDMLDTMESADGAGLAANQIGVMKRIMIFGFESNPRYPDAEPVPFTVLVNPEFEVLGEEMESGWEGCLSVPGMMGFVARPARIRYSGLDQYGKPVQREADGFHARVFQHEFDHLDGRLYPDRIEDLTRFGFVEELQASGALEYADSK